MPQIIFKGLPEQKVADLSTPLATALATIMDTPEDWFTIEYLPNRFYFGGQKIAHSPLVQVFWFDRGQQVQDAAATAIHQALLEQGETESEISFHPLEKAAYYENGAHY